MIIVPARYGSTRLEAKALAPIEGVPMAVRTAKIAEGIDRVVVATDDARIAQACDAHGVESIMTSPEHQSGTDRVNEAAERLGLADEALVVNLQGDEPLLEPEILRAFHAFATEKNHAHPEWMMASVHAQMASGEAHDPARVKTILNARGEAIYFSRSAIPFDRDGAGQVPYRLHLGLYAYRRASLRRFCGLAPSFLEQAEKLEQLRATEAGLSIFMLAVGATRSFGIDMPEDLERARMILRGVS